MSRHLLIFDLDETLVHARKEPLTRTADFTVEGYFIYLRPHLSTLLDTITPRFDLAVWSSASHEYVQQISNKLFRDIPLKFVWSVERCVQRVDVHSGGYLYIKDLRKVQGQGYALEDITMIDDTAAKISRQPRNHIPIAPYHGEDGDTELLKLAQHLTVNL